MLYTNLILSESLEKQKAQSKSISFDWMPELRDVSISGMVYNKQTKFPEANIPIYVSVFKNNPQFHINQANENGEFIFSLNNLESFQDIFLCPIAEYENELEIKINSDFSAAFPATKKNPLRLNTSHEELIRELFVNQQTNTLFNISSVSKQKPLYQFPINIKEPPISILLENYIDLNSLETVFREIIPNCLVRKKSDQYSILVVDALYSFNSENPLILIDNIPVISVNELFKIHPSKIKKISVFPSNLILGDNLIKGLIMITTNTDDFAGIARPNGSVFLEYQTIAPSFTFDSPIYNSEEKKLSRLADFRTLLYWNPNVELSKGASVSFYTSDHCSEYDVIVRGITKDGKNCFGRASFNVVSK